MKKTNWYFEDFFPGQQIAMGARSLSQDEIIAFGKQFDPQPFHVDPDAATSSIYGGIIASGWHTCSMMMRMVVDGLMSESSSMGSPGLDGVRWMAPVRPGDMISVVYATTKVKASGSRPDRGLVWSQWQATNQRGELVCTVDGVGMFGRRPGSDHA